jgi:fumarate reductase subunit D
MQNGAVLRALGFFLKMAPAIVLVLALESKAPIGSKNLSAGKTSRIIQFITNFLTKFALLISDRRNSHVLRVIEFVNGA